jgi:hypothetical protein
VQKSLEEKVRQEGVGAQPGPVITEDMQRAVEDVRKTKEIIEKIRYGQYQTGGRFRFQVWVPGSTFEVGA